MNKKTNKKKTFLIVIITIAILLVSVSFVTSTTYTQLAISSLLYPPLVYFAFKCFSQKGKREDAQRLVVKVKSEAKARKAPVEIVDIDKRAFLKMIGAAGFSFFIFSLFTRRVEDLILKRNYGTDRLIDNRDTSPIEPTEGYRVTEISTEDFNYYGFVNTKGNWYIMKEDPTEGSFRYTKADLNFSKNWERREKLKYDYYHIVFK